MSTSRTPLSVGPKTVLTGGLWLEEIMIAVSLFSLGRETAERSWPVWHMVAYCAVLGASCLLMAGTLALLRRGRPQEEGAPQRPIPGQSRPR